MPLEPTTNPLFADNQARTVDMADLESPHILARPRRTIKRELSDLRRKQTAIDSLVPLTQDNEIYGFTKGQFSMLDLLQACAAKTGPAHLVISTWTASAKEIMALSEMVASGAFTGISWLIDHSFASRDKAAAHQIRKSFGTDAVRVAHVHAKFFTLHNPAWKLVARTSMNLNMNPRFEDFTIANDPEVFDFLSALIDEIWAKQQLSQADKMGRGEFQRYFDLEM